MNLRQGRIGDRECRALYVLIAVTNTVFLTSGHGFYEKGNQAWLTVPAGAATACIVFLLTARAMQRRSCGNLMEFYADAVGAVAAIPWGFLTAVVLIAAAALPLTRMLFVLHRFIFVEAGADQIAIYLLLALFPLVWLGLESVGRTAKLLCLPVVLSYFLMMCLGLPDYEIYRLYPLLGGDLSSFALIFGISLLCFLAPLSLLLVCGRGMHGIWNVKRNGTVAVVLSATVSVLLQLAIGTAFSYRQLRRIDAPIYQLLLSVRGGTQLRLDKILLSIWMMAMFLGASGLIYASSLQLCHTFRIRDIRPIGSACVVLCVTLALLGHNSAWVSKELFGLLLRYTGSVLLILLILPCMVSFMKKERGLCESDV